MLQLFNFASLPSLPMNSGQIIQPDIFLFGLRIQEPMTVLTDILIALVCFYAYRNLSKTDNRSTNLMRYYFLALGWSTIFGGLVGHAFVYAVGPVWKLIGWYLAMFSVLILEFAVLEQAQPLLKPQITRFITKLNFVVWAGAMIMATYQMNFAFVEIQTAYGIMGVFMPLSLYTYMSTKHRGSKYMLYSVLTLMTTIIVFRAPIVLHTYFNHRDLAHIVICLAVLFMFKGTALYHEKEIKRLAQPLLSSLENDGEQVQQ